MEISENIIQIFMKTYICGYFTPTFNNKLQNLFKVKF